MQRPTSVSALDAFCTTGTSPTYSPPEAPVRRRTGCRRSPEASSGALELPAGLQLELGTLPAATTVRYELVGAGPGPLVVVLGGISADCHVASNETNPEPGWWEAQVGVGGSGLDTRELRVLSFDFLGGPTASSGSTTAPAADWPPITTADQADLLATLLDELAGERIALLVGASYGGMVGLRFAARHPDRLRRLLVIGAAHRNHPMATAWRWLQRRIVRLGTETGRSNEGLEIARGLAMTTYRSSLEFEGRFVSPHSPARPDEPVGASARAPVQEYLAARGRSFAARFETRAFLRLSESLDLHAVDPGSIRTPTTLVTVDTDVLVPPWLVQELATGLAGPVTTHRLSSPRGHDAFLTDTGPIAEVLRAAAQEALR